MKKKDIKSLYFTIITIFLIIFSSIFFTLFQLRYLSNDRIILAKSVTFEDDDELSEEFSLQEDGIYVFSIDCSGQPVDAKIIVNDDVRDSGVGYSFVDGDPFIQKDDVVRFTLTKVDDGWSSCSLEIEKLR